jgi:hypothetical protein
MLTTRILTPMLFIAATLLGCKAEDPPEDGPPPPLAAEDAAESFARQICASLYACECSGAGDFGSEDACVEELRVELQASIDEALAAGGTWDDDCAGSLVAAWKTWQCLGPVSARREMNYDPRMCPALKGTLAPGADCNVSSIGDDCRVGSVCVSGVCVETEVPIPIGGVCVFDWQELPCVAEGYCAYDSDSDVSTRICAPLPSEGDACDGDYSCGPSSLNLMCNYETLTCEVGPAAGEPCFEGFSCGPGLYCDGGKDFTCQERYDIGDGCAVDAVCPIDASCVGNLCEAQPPAVCALINFGF